MFHTKNPRWSESASSDGEITQGKSNVSFFRTELKKLRNSRLAFLGEASARGC